MKSIKDVMWPETDTDHGFLQVRQTAAMLLVFTALPHLIDALGDTGYGASTWEWATVLFTLALAWRVAVSSSRMVKFTAVIWIVTSRDYGMGWENFVPAVLGVLTFVALIRSWDADDKWRKRNKVAGTRMKTSFGSMALNLAVLMLSLVMGIWTCMGLVVDGMDGTTGDIPVDGMDMHGMPIESLNFRVDGHVLVYTAVMSGTAREGVVAVTGADMPDLLEDLCRDPQSFAMASAGLQTRTRFVDVAGTEVVSYSTEEC